MTGAINALRLSLRALAREWRAGELRVLAAAVVVAVASVTAVAFFTDRARLAMERNAGELLAADLVVTSPYPLELHWAQEAQRQGLETAQTQSFVSVVVSGGEPQLTEVKAVGAGYPLRGALRTASEPFGADARTRDIPARGTVWADARLLASLGLAVGDRLELGASRLRVDRVLAYEPDRGGDLFSIAPRLLLNLADVPATHLIQPGSRVEYRLLLAGGNDRLAAFRAWLTFRLPAGVRILGVHDARPELRTALARAEQYLGLASLVSAILAGVAIATAARRFAARHLDTAAVMRCLGASSHFVLAVFATQILALALVASLAGTVVGYAAQGGLALLLGDLVAADLPAPSLVPLGLGLAVGVILLLGFALPPITRLKAVPPLRVIRRDLGPLPVRAVSMYLSAAAAVAALVAWTAADARLATWVLLGLAVTLLLLTVVAMLLVRALALLRNRGRVALRFGIAHIPRRAQASRVQIVAFGVGIMALLLLSLVRADLLAGWRKTLPDDAPNRFLINIQPDQVAPLQAFLREHAGDAPHLFPMVRGRLVARNGHVVTPDNYAEPRARRLAEREFNLSWTTAPPTDNELVAGRWWTPAEHGQALLSVEQGLAETLGLELGDRVSFRIGADELTATIASLRKVDWDSFRVNFFVVTPPGVLDGYPATYVTSFYLSPAERQLAATLVRAFPNVTVIDVDAIMGKVREVMDRATAAVEFIFVFSLLAGGVVLLAAIQATQDERRQEAAILRTLGASRRQLLSALAAEFVALGTLAGLLAAVAASAIGYVLATQVFHVAYHFNAWLWLAGVASGGIGIGLAGVLVTRRVVDRPPLAALRAG